MIFCISHCKPELGILIIELNRSPVANAADLNAKVQNPKNAGTLLLKVKRGNFTRFVAIER